MGNTLIKVVNIDEYKAYTFINENDILSDTQARLKESDDKLLLEITQISAKCDHNNIGSTKHICEAIREHKKNEWVSFSNNVQEGKMEKYIYENLFVNSIKAKDDFIKAYIVEEEKINIWIIIEESTFEYNEKYLSAKNEFQSVNKTDFDILIFDKDDIEEVEEELMYIKCCQRINKNG